MPNIKSPMLRGLSFTSILSDIIGLVHYHKGSRKLSNIEYHFIICNSFLLSRMVWVESESTEVGVNVVMQQP